VIPFVEAISAIAGAMFLPALGGLILVSVACRVARPATVAAFAIGVYLWFFSDTLGDSSYLGFVSGFTGGSAQAALPILFGIGAIAFIAADSKAFDLGEVTSGAGLAVPILVALALGIHGIGEGADFGSTAFSTGGTDVVGAFGGAAEAVSFILHKGLEPMMVGAVYWAYARGGTVNWRKVARDILVLSVVFAVPGIAGAAFAYYSPFDTTYIFALGAGASVYAAVLLAKAMFSSGSSTRSTSITYALVLLFGFFCLYFAALFHS
jgi:hypothetical protein